MEDGASNQLLEDWSYKQNVDIVKDGMIYLFLILKQNEKNINEPNFFLASLSRLQSCSQYLWNLYDSSTGLIH